MFTLIDHIGFVVSDLEEAVAHYRTAFGIDEWEYIMLPERHASIAVAQLGNTLIELITPTSPMASFARFLREKGPGMHHIAYRVENITEALATLQARGVPMIDQEARPGIHDTLVAFVHPKAGNQGVLIELVQHAPHTNED